MQDIKYLYIMTRYFRSIHSSNSYVPVCIQKMVYGQWQVESALIFVKHAG